MINVRYYKTNTDRKQDKVFGEFYPAVTVAEVPEVSEELKGKIAADGRDMYEVATERREKQIEKAVLDAKFAACDAVREIVGEEGVLVAYEVKESEEE